ncbi:DUF1835 domain-containing protein [Aminipila sp.]
MDNNIYNKSIPKDKPITIWNSENFSEQAGLRYILYL